MYDQTNESQSKLDSIAKPNSEVVSVAESDAPLSDSSSSTSPSPSYSDILKKGDEIAKRIEEANKKSEEILRQQQELAARKLLGGGTEITPQQEQKREETPKEYKDRIMRGEL